jgi:hypothetical protein
MSRNIRYEKCGALFAEDLGDLNPFAVYTGTDLIDSPYGKARRFNGTDEFISFGNQNQLNFTTDSVFTLMVRMYIPTNSTGGYLFCKSGIINILDEDRMFSDDIIFEDTRIWDDTSAEDVPVGWGLLLTAQNTLTFHGDGGQDTFSVEDIPTNQWISVAIVHNSNTMSIYINGVLAGNGLVGTITSTTHPVLLGGGSTTFDGSIKELVVINHSVTAQEALDFHHLNMFNYDQYLISRWNMDNLTEVTDTGWTNSGNHGAVFGTNTLRNTEYGQGIKFSGAGGSRVAFPGLSNFAEPEFTCISVITRTSDVATFNVLQSLGGDLSAAITPYSGVTVRVDDSMRLQLVVARVDNDTALTYTSNIVLATNTTYIIATRVYNNECLVLCNGVPHISVMLATNVAYASSTRLTALGAGSANGNITSSTKATIGKTLLYRKALTMTQLIDVQQRMRIGEL